MKEVAIYGVFDAGKQIFSGTRQEIADNFRVKKSSMNVYISGRCLLKGTYEVIRTGSEMRYVEYHPVLRAFKRKKSDSEDELDYKKKPYETLLWHMRVYGNTSTPFDPSVYLDDLSKEGFNCKITPVQEHIERSKITHRKQKPKTYYYVEVI
jgi:hypothetical protein